MKDLVIEYRDKPHCKPSPNHHKITSKDKAVIIGISKIEELSPRYISNATENDTNVIHDIFIDNFGLKPSSIHLLSARSRIQPTLKNIKKCLKETMSSMKSDSTLFVYLSGQCYDSDSEEKCYVLPQDYSKTNPNTQFQITALYPYIKKCKAKYLIFFLDCDNSEIFVKPLVESVQELKQELYLITSCAGKGMSLSDERVLGYSYMTFLIKQYIKQSQEKEVSLAQLTLYITNYSEPLSRFTYHHSNKQVCMSPVMIHKSRDGNVEVDGLTPSTNELTRWKAYLQTTITYKTWLKEREEDARTLFADETFVNTKLFAHVFLTCLKSLGVLLCDLDNVHHEVCKTEFPILCEALHLVAEEFFEPFVSAEHCRCRDYSGMNGLYMVYIRTGFNNGAGMLLRKARKNGGLLGVSESDIP